ncbi:hypothetical protein KKA03_06175 [archaeon]|nr:hypothetical protein [archaeon]
MVAKNFYSIAEDPFPLPDYYFAAHLVGYPLMIRIFSFLGYFPSMLFVTLLFSTLSIRVFYKLLKAPRASIFKEIEYPFYEYFLEGKAIIHQPRIINKII